MHRAFLASVRVLGEGVDITGERGVDSICFADTRGSQVEIVQNIGRALCLNRDGSTKVARIIVPVFLEPDEDPQDMVASASFEPLVAVLQGLRSHDAHLVGQLASRALTSGQRTIHVQRDENGRIVSAGDGSDGEDQEHDDDDGTDAAAESAVRRSAKAAVWVAVRAVLPLRRRRLLSVAMNQVRHRHPLDLIRGSELQHSEDAQHVPLPVGRRLGFSGRPGPAPDALLHYKEENRRDVTALRLALTSNFARFRRPGTKGGSQGTSIGATAGRCQAWTAGAPGGWLVRCAPYEQAGSRAGGTGHQRAPSQPPEQNTGSMRGHPLTAV